jgi:hypothetical protein
MVRRWVRELAPPRQLNRYMTSTFTPRAINLDDWRELVLLAIAGVCLLAIVGFVTYAAIDIATWESEQLISGPVTITSAWSEFIPSKPLRPAKQYQLVVLDVDPTEGLVVDNSHLERMRLANGVLLKPEIELLDSQGNVFVAQVHRAPVPSSSNNGIIGSIPDLPQDRAYTKVRVRSNEPVHLARIVWSCSKAK